jgi:hypothetical protein
VSGHGPDWALVLTVGAVLFAVVGTVGTVPLLVAVAIVALFVAIGCVIADEVTAPSTLAASAFAVTFAGAGATIVGYALRSDLLTFGGWGVVIAGAIVTVAELWGTT